MTEVPNEGADGAGPADDGTAAGPPLAFLREHRGSLVETAETLLSFDTQNPPGETRELADRVETELAGLGLETETYAVDPAKPNVLARLPGDGDATLCLNGHLDTVPFDDAAWAHDPLGERDGDRLYGRGATDMKSQLAAMLAVARAYVETDTTPPVALLFAFVSDEETGGDAGLRAVLDAGKLRADACVIGETTCERGRHAVTVADRGSIWLTLEAAGESAHGSRPAMGDNAIDRLYEAVVTLRDRFGSVPLAFDDEMAAVVEESVEYYAPQMGEAAARELFEYPSINLGTIEGGDAINTVPATATAEVDIRLTAGVDTREVLAAIRECADECRGVTIADVSWSLGSYEPIDGPLSSAVAETAEDVAGDRVFRRSATGGGDTKKLRHAGVPTVEFGFGTDTVHGVDEYTTVAALAANAEVYARVPFAYAERLEGDDGRTTA